MHSLGWEAFRRSSAWSSKKGSKTICRTLSHPQFPKPVSVQIWELHITRLSFYSLLGCSCMCNKVASFISHTSSSNGQCTLSFFSCIHIHHAQCCMHMVEQVYGRWHIHTVLTLLLFSSGYSQYLSCKDAKASSSVLLDALDQPKFFQDLRARHGTAIV
jgi:hypothetical protein